MFPYLTATDATQPVFLKSEIHKIMDQILTHVTDGGFSYEGSLLYSDRRADLSSVPGRHSTSFRGMQDEEGR